MDVRRKKDCETESDEGERKTKKGGGVEDRK